MTNPYFNASGTPAQGSGVDSPAVRSEFAAIAQGFDKLPTLSGNAYKIVFINASGSAMGVFGGTGLLKLSTSGSPSIATPGTDYLTTLGAAINGATAKTTPVDADEMGIADSADSFNGKKVSLANFKAFLKTYFDGIYTTAAAVVSYVSGLIGSTIQAYDAATAKTNQTQTWSKPQRPYYTSSDTASGGGSFSYDGNTKGQICLITCTTAGTLTMNAPANIVEGQPYSFIFKAGDTGARTLAWNAAFKFPSATATLSTMSTTSGGYDVIDFIGGAGNTLIARGTDVR